MNLLKNREEINTISHHSREELGNMLKGVGDSLYQQFNTLTQTNNQKIEKLREIIEQRLNYIKEENSKKLEQVRQELLNGTKNLREEISLVLKGFNESLVNSIGETGRLQKSQLDVFSERLDKLTQSNEIKYLFTALIIFYQ